jgi:hypothetical protein
MLFKTSIGLLFLCLGFQAQAADENEFEAFFTRYETLGNQFDVAVAELYSDDAKVTGIRLMPDGSEKTLTFDGKKWKQLVVDLMSMARERSDSSQFSNILVSEEADSAKITATRYSTIKCHEDKDYYMVVKKNAEGKIQIIEEQTKAPQQSKCENASKDDLSITLKAIVTMLGKQLPVMLDADTKLEKIWSEGNMLMYEYELVNHASTEIDSAGFEAVLKPTLLKQTCTTTSMKSILDQGGSISYRYNGKDKMTVAEISLNKDSCGP